MRNREIPVLLLVLFCICHFSLGNYTSSDEMASYLKGVEGELISFSGKEMKIRVTNRNPEGILLTNRLKQKKKFLIITPDVRRAGIEVDSSRFGLFENGRMIREISKKEWSRFRLSTGSMVSFKSYGTFRSWKMGGLDVLVTQSVPESKSQIVRLLDIEFRVIFPQSSAGVRENNFEDSFAWGVLNGITLNPQCMASYRLPRKMSMKEFQPLYDFAGKVNDSLTSGPAVKFLVYEEGLYGFNGNQLRAAGVPVDEIDPDRMALYHKDVQIPLYVDARSRFTLGTDDKCYFYAPPPDKDSPFDAYWLLYEKDTDSNPPKRISRQEERRIESPTPVERGIFSVPATAAFFKNNKYYHKLPTPHVNGRWYWDEVQLEEYHSYKVDLSGVNKKAKTFRLTLHLVGAARGRENFCDVFWNSHKVDSCQWRGLTNHTMKKDLPIKYLAEGENELYLYVPPVQKERQSRQIYMIGFKVDYSMNLSNDNLHRPFTIEKKKDSRGHYIWFNRPEDRNFFLVDITRPLAPSIISIFRNSAPGRPEYNSCAGVLLDQKRRFVLGSWEKARSIPAIVPVSRLRLYDEEEMEGDYVVVSHSRFLRSLDPLLEYRSQKGLKPLLVNVDEIYDCFNYGEKDPDAIKRFFKYRYYFAPDPLLRYGLLVGETSDFMGDPADLPPDGQIDLVPTCGYGTPMHKKVHGDAEYATICGDDDLPDFGLGRFPVNDVEEIDVLTRKIKSYENDLPLGDWRIRHAFVTDDEQEFSKIANRIIEDRFPQTTHVERIFQQKYPYSDLVLLWERKTSLTARDNLIKTLNDGVLTMNYFGHGGPNLWTSERLFHINDIPLLENGKRMFFLTASTCDTCWLDYPVPPVKKSLGERFLLAPKGGAIGIYGPTTGASPSDHSLLMSLFYQGIFEKGVRNLTEAVTCSKIAFRFERKNKHLLDQFIFLGDPAISLPLPEETATITADPGFLNARSGGTITIKGQTGSQPFWGLTRVLIQPPNPDSPSVELKTHAFDGSFQVDYSLEPDADTGTYKVTTYSDNVFAGVEEIGETSFENIYPDIKLNLDVDSGKTERIIENSDVDVTAVISNPSNVTLEGVRILLMQKGIKTPILDKTLTLKPFHVTRYSLSWVAEAGIHTLSLEARLPAQYKKAPQTQETGKDENTFTLEKFIPVYSKTAFNRIAVDPDEIKTRSGAIVDGQKPEFLVPIYNIGTQAFYKLNLRLLVGGSLIGKPKSIMYLKSGQRVEVPFQSEASFPIGNIPVEVKVEAFNQQTEKYDEIFRTLRVFEVIKPMDIIVVPGSVTFESEHFLSGETVFIDAIVKNTGGILARDFIVEAYRDEPLKKHKALETFFFSTPQKIDLLRPGREKKVRIRWDKAQRAEKVEIYVVANSGRKFEELDFDNNIAHATLTIKEHTNLKIDPDKVQIPINVIRKGDQVKVDFVVENDSKLQAGVFDIAFEDWGINKRWETCSDPIRVAGLEPGKSIDLSTRWDYRSGRNHFRITVNPSFILQENKRDDNEAEFSFPIVDYLPNLQKTSSNTYSFHNVFMSGKTSELYIDPLPHISPTQFEGAGGLRYDVSDKQYIVEGAPVKHPDLGENRNDQWTLLDIWLASSPMEDVDPITYSLPLPEESDTTMCDVYIYCQTIQDYFNFPASKVRVKIENEQSFFTYDFTRVNSPYTTRKYLLGRYDTVDKFLDITIDDVPERVWTIVNHIEIVPIHASYESVVLEVPGYLRKNRFSCEFNDIKPYKTRIEYTYRFATQTEEGRFQFGEWKPYNIDENDSIPLETRYLQWRADFFGWEQLKPLLKDARITFHQ